MIGFVRGKRGFNVVRQYTQGPCFGAENVKNNSVNNIRDSFIDYFRRNRHTVIASAPIRVANDSSLLFTNAGMVPLKDCFMQKRAPAAKCLVSVQNCVRAGGKHNDLDNVGYTSRHQTYFEMLGNFSFGGYDRKEAMRLAWSYLIDEIKLPQDKLMVTVHELDTLSYDLWRSPQLNIPANQIIKLNSDDNLWSMADTGPFGYCTEIHWNDGSIEDPNLLEIWNIVFMDKMRSDEDMTVSALSPMCIDTGMGLERIASILQGKQSNFEIDTFTSLIDIITGHLNTNRLLDDRSMAGVRIIADHLRCAGFLIAQGTFPGKQGADYVLQKILRRSFLHIDKLKLPHTLFPEFYNKLNQITPEKVVPEFTINIAAVIGTVTREKEIYDLLIKNSEKLFIKALKRAKIDYTTSNIVPESILVTLYQSNGLPIDVLEELCSKYNQTMDKDHFIYNLSLLN